MFWEKNDNYGLYDLTQKNQIHEYNNTSDQDLAKNNAP